MVQVRNMAAVLFRRLLSNIEDFDKVTEDIKGLCKTQLLHAVQNEQDNTQRKKICDCLAELAKCYIGKF